MSSQHATDVPHGHQVDLETGLDFVNTLEYSKGLPAEHLESIRTALIWLFEHDLMHRDKLQLEMSRLGADQAAADRVLARIRKVRAAMRELVDASVERRPAEGRQVDEVNRALRTPYSYYLIPGPDGV
jgi:hypothetical protein